MKTHNEQFALSDKQLVKPKLSEIREPIMTSATLRILRVLTGLNFGTACFIGMALNICGVCSTKAQGYVSFDQADSSVQNGIYCFLLYGITSDMGSPYHVTGLTLSGFSTIDNTQTLTAVSSPSGWQCTSSDTDAVSYELFPFFTDLNGLLTVTAAPNLTGNINWSFSLLAEVGSVVPTPLGGSTSINTVPEPSSFALFGITGIACLLAFYGRAKKVPGSETICHRK